MNILRTIVWFIYFFLVLLFMLPMRIKADKMKKNGDKAAYPYIFKKVKWWANSLLKLAGVEITVYGRENILTDCAVVFTPNHSGLYDIPVMLTCCNEPPALVAKKESKKIPLVGGWMHLLDCLYIDRENPRAAAATMNEAAQLVMDGRNLVIFPEGTRSKTGELGEFKHGAFKMAFKAKAPIVPVVIEGTRDIMENHHNIMTPGKVTVRFLPPIYTADLDRAAQKLLPEEIKRMIEANKGM